MYFNFEEVLSKCDFGVNAVNAYDIKTEILSIKNEQSLLCDVSYNTYTFELKRNRLDKNKKSIIIICSKDNSGILEYSLSKIKEYGINNDHDILLVDDRSADRSILNLSDDFEVSYLRIDNSHNCFNYSVINNIAAAYAKYYEKELLIFYNNDLWPSSKDTLPNIIKKHKEHNSGITGCKLIYPTKTEYQNMGKPEHILQQYINNAYETIQHGGISFVLKQSSFVDQKRKYISNQIVLAPMHQWRFFAKNTHMASFDAQCFAVTGAIHIINTDLYISLGGLDVRFAIAFQDIDICIRAIEKNINVTYIGTECMYHAESITNHKENTINTNTFTSDNILWDYIYGAKLPTILGLQLNHA